MAQTIQSLYEDTAKSQEKSDSEVLKEISAKLDNAQATAAQAASSAQAKQASSDIDWMKALETGASILLDVVL